MESEDRPIERIRRRVLISGRVQGVWFRGATLDAARKLRLDGFVRNRPDGRVEAVFEGAPVAVAELVRFCRHGPPAARVSGVDVRREEPEGLAGFEIRSG